MSEFSNIWHPNIVVLALAPDIFSMLEGEIVLQCTVMTRIILIKKIRRQDENEKVDGMEIVMYLRRVPAIVWSND
jgi:hypothetical protein